MAPTSPPTIAPFIDHVARLYDVPGDFIEFGIFRARSFSMTLPLAIQQGKMAHGVDSFEGLAEPGQHDITINGENPYPKGRFHNGGVNEIRELLHEFPDDSYQLHKGFIPDVLDYLQNDMQLSFAFLDLDHYAPTVAALNWAWPRLAHGGLMVCDDFLQHATDTFSSRAILEFIHSHEPKIVSINVSRIAFRKV